MPKRIPSYLKLHTEEPTENTSVGLQEIPGLENLCGAFHALTGWPLVCRSEETGGEAEAWSMPIDASANRPRAQLAIPSQASAEAGDNAAGLGRSPLDETKQLAEELGRLLGKLEHAQQVVWEREAELAAGVPVRPRPDEEEHLAVRLEAVLQGGAEAVGCHAAAVYLLDEATSQLKLRASWGLTRDRFFDKPRPLRGAVADLEALMGHAVVLEDTSLLPSWRPPEQFASAVCVPVSSPTTPLGTLWMFGRQIRHFTRSQTNIIEIIAGRVAAELEREMLLTDGIQSKQLGRHMIRAAMWQDERLPRITPLLDDWQLAGWTSQAACIGGDFYDWSVLPDGALSVVVGAAHGELVDCALNAAVVHSAVKSHSCYPHEARQILHRINDTLWTSSTGDQFASLIYGSIAPETGELDCAVAGPAGGILVHAASQEQLADGGPLVGTGPDSAFRARRAEMRPGDALLLFSEGVRKVVQARGDELDERAIAQRLRSQKGASAEELLEAARELLGVPEGETPDADLTLLVISRRE